MIGNGFEIEECASTATRVHAGGRINDRCAVRQFAHVLHKKLLVSGSRHEIRSTE